MSPSTQLTFEAPWALALGVILPLAIIALFAAERRRLSPRRAAGQPAGAEGAAIDALAATGREAWPIGTVREGVGPATVTVEGSVLG